MEWAPKYDLGLEIIDQQHEHIIDILNRLHISVCLGKQDEKLTPKIFSDLLDYTIEHFLSEEKLQKSTHYPGLALHQQQHKNFILATTTLGKQHGPMDLIPVLDFFKGWFIDHTQGSDRLFVNYLQKLKSNELVRTQLIESSRIASLEEMTAGILYEINNPLSVILARTSELLEELKKGGMIEKDFLENSLIKINNTAVRISETVNGFRSFSTQNQLRAIIDQSILLCGERFRTHEVALSVFGDQNTEAVCHPLHLSQVLLSLLNNAFDAVKSLPEKWVRIHLEENPNNISIRVIDSGLGIHEHLLPKIMDPFFTTKPTGEGTGLGLSISKELMEKAGGRLYYDPSSPNTSFVIELKKIPA